MTDGHFNFSEEDLTEIPKFFRCTLKNEQFEHCSMCEETLEDSNYIIEKLIQNNEPIVEFALCTKCIEGLMASLSKESIKNMREQDDPFLYSEGDCCISCQKKESEAKRSIHIGMFLGYQYVTDSHIWTCSTCIKSKQKNLSKKTREKLEDFNRDILSPFSSDLDLPVFSF